MDTIPDTVHPSTDELPVERIDVAALKGANCALIDTSTLRVLSDGPISWFLTHTDSSRIGSTEDLTRFDTTEDQINTALDVLARFVAYDFLVVDSRLLASAARVIGGGKLRRPVGAEFIRAVDTPLSFYVGAARNVHLAAQAIGYDPYEGTPPAVAAQLTDLSCWDHLEKSDIDDLYEWVRDIKWIADSDQSALRSLFYLELARYATVPVFLTHAKLRNLHSVGSQMIREALRLIQARVDQAVFDNLRLAVREAYGQVLDVSWPPLVRYIVSIAARERISLYEAALRVRSLPTASGFRSWLGKLQRHLLNPKATNDLMAAEKILRELAALAELWGDECNSKYGVRYRKRIANVGALPGIGRVLQVAGISQLPLRDPLLTDVEDHVAFIAGWYSESPGDYLAG